MCADLQNLLCDKWNELLFCHSLQVPKSCSDTETGVVIRLDGCLLLRAQTFDKIAP
jgi:hypothetical protein